MNYNKQHEINKVIEQMRVPISDINHDFDRERAQLKSDGTYIGEIIFSKGTGVISYDIKNILPTLDWQAVYKNNKEAIDKLCAEHIDDGGEFVVQVNNQFRSLKVQPKNINLRAFYVECNWNNGQWSVFKTN